MPDLLSLRRIENFQFYDNTVVSDISQYVQSYQNNINNAELDYNSLQQEMTSFNNDDDLILNTLPDENEQNNIILTMAA